ncbi:xanthine dehydrogenase accessory protein XdhC [Vibrio rumoiensis]|uniref:Xanthine dehydrogenase accessory protein XdhC n=1 Tax=Vibrio rumoiensis TaxID=76258 RepID=A0ABW7J1X8_9VIBR|nr:xanthine dehydrogenase accessory protein XdhC [Vibrio rumoiensis]
MPTYGNEHSNPTSQVSWIQQLALLEQQGEACILVSVLEDKGSVPRDAGTKMIVTRNELYATIGGGHLEHLATQMAREMLISIGDGKTDNKIHIERFNLGARLGQCCGGMATLSFEPIGFNQHHLVLFGAGHVAKALVNIVQTLPFKITWVDEREAEFPDYLAPNVHKLVTDDPVGEIKHMPLNSYYLVMTHNHQLDFDLAREILSQDHFSYFGMIGSQTKRKKFDLRLAHRGFEQGTIEKMQCPIGIAIVKGKHPAEIAVSVAGELIAHYQGETLEAKRPLKHNTLVG